MALSSGLSLLPHGKNIKGGPLFERGEKKNIKGETLATSLSIYWPIAIPINTIGHFLGTLAHVSLPILAALI